MAERLVPEIALDYIRRKKPAPAFSYKDVWNEEHAAGFTVAKAMQLGVLADIKSEVEKAVETGGTLEEFRKNPKPLLQKKGWWGRKTMTDPLTGGLVDAQLGSDRRLKTIYATNLRSAYMKGAYDRAMSSDAHPYLMYRVGPSVRHREEHLGWDGLVLPKDDPWWSSHMPPNGWGCKCKIVAVSEARKERYERRGRPYYDPNQHKTVYRPIKTTRPTAEYRAYVNERKGTVERVPKGVTPGFNWNQGQAGRVDFLKRECMKKAREKFPAAADKIERLLDAKTKGATAAAKKAAEHAVHHITPGKGFARSLREEFADTLRPQFGVVGNETTGIGANLNGRSLKKLSSGKAVEASKKNGFTLTQHFEAVRLIAKLYEKATLVEAGHDKNGSPDVLSVKRFDAPLVLSDGTKANAWITVKETKNNGHTIYSLELRK